MDSSLRFQTLQKSQSYKEEKEKDYGYFFTCRTQARFGWLEGIYKLFLINIHDYVFKRQPRQKTNNCNTSKPISIQQFSKSIS